MDKINPVKNCSACGVFSPLDAYCEEPTIAWKCGQCSQVHRIAGLTIMAWLQLAWENGIEEGFQNGYEQGFDEGYNQAFEDLDSAPPKPLEVQE